MCDGQQDQSAEFGVNGRVARRSFPRLSGTFRGAMSAALPVLLLISCGDDDFMLNGTWKGEAGSWAGWDENGWEVNPPSSDDGDEWVLDMERSGIGIFGTFHVDWLGTEKQGELSGWYHGISFKNSRPSITLYVYFEHDNVDIECEYGGGVWVDDDRINGHLHCRGEYGERWGELNLVRG